MKSINYTIDIEWQMFPKNIQCPNHLKEVINVFKKHVGSFESPMFTYSSDEVLAILRDDFVILGYKVEKSKSKCDKIEIPVLYGRNGNCEKYFEADAYNADAKTVIEVEAGRAVSNYQFLKDIFEASVMNDVDYCVIAVRRIYRDSRDFDKVIQFLETLYSSIKLSLPLKGILIIGY